MEKYGLIRCYISTRNKMISSLYKYFPARDSFFDNYLIRATNKLGLNDPFEVNPSIDFFISFCQVTGEKCFGNTSEEIKEYLLSLPPTSNLRNLGLTWYKAKCIKQ